MSLLFYSLKRRGRPRKYNETKDLGTKELQEKRSILLSAFNKSPGLPSSLLIKALGGCFLHQRFCQGYIDAQQLKVGLTFKKIFNLAIKSMGIKTRLSSISKKWDNFSSYDDTFESENVEAQWCSLNKIFSPFKTSRTINREILNYILLDGHQNGVNIEQSDSPDFIQALQSALDEIGKIINKLIQKVH